MIIECSSCRQSFSVVTTEGQEGRDVQPTCPTCAAAIRFIVPLSYPPECGPDASPAESSEESAAGFDTDPFALPTQATPTEPRQSAPQATPTEPRPTMPKVDHTEKVANSEVYFLAESPEEDTDRHADFGDETVFFPATALREFLDLAPVQEKLEDEAHLSMSRAEAPCPDDDGVRGPAPLVREDTKNAISAKTMSPPPEPPTPGDAGVESPAPLVRENTTTAISAKTVRPPPKLPHGVEGYLLVVGAEPGCERLRLPSAKTVVGLKGADLEVSGSGISGCHFQIEVAGQEFFIRDLDSTNGTFLNGRKVRYTELEPGDEIRIGFTTLVFRTSGDRLGRAERSHEAAADATPIP